MDLAMNATVTHTDLFLERNMLTFFVYLELEGGSSQPFGGWRLDSDLGGKLIKGLMNALNKERWGHWEDTEVEVMGTPDKLSAIRLKGSDKWFVPIVL